MEVRFELFETTQPQEMARASAMSSSGKAMAMAMVSGYAVYWTPY
jgi:hypothetical protein